MNRSRSIALAAYLAAVLTTVGAGAAGAIPVGPPTGTPGPPTGGCPAGGEWLLVQPSGPEHLSAQYDFNNDNKVCARLTPGAIAFMDNVVQ